ncbi:hypothetical protein ACN6QQ_15300, partial [Acinetobacter baumannii]
MQSLSNRQSLIASYILMGIFLLSVIPLHLLSLIHISEPTRL